MKFYKLGKKSLIMSVMLGSIVLTGCTTQANKEENLDNKIKKLDYLRSRIKNNHIILNAPVRKEIKKLERLR